MVNHICNSRCHSHVFMLADVMLMMSMADVMPNVADGIHCCRCYGHIVVCRRVADFMATILLTGVE